MSRTDDLSIDIDLPEDSRDYRARLVAFYGGEAAYAALIVARHLRQAGLGALSGVLAAPPPPPQSVSTSRETTGGLWNAGSTADFLGVSMSWVYHRAAEGALPCIRIRGALRFEPEQIRAYLRGEHQARNRVVLTTRAR